MTPETFSLMSEAKLIPANYANQAREARKTREDKMKHLMKQVMKNVAIVRGLII